MANENHVSSEGLEGVQKYLILYKEYLPELFDIIKDKFGNKIVEKDGNYELVDWTDEDTVAFSYTAYAYDEKYTGILRTVPTYTRHLKLMAENSETPVEKQPGDEDNQ